MIFITAEAIHPGHFVAQINKAALGVANNVPEVLQYLDFENPRELTEIDNSSSLDVVAVPVQKRLFTHWLNPWAAKQIAGMWFRQTGKVVQEDQVITVNWVSSALDADLQFFDLIENALPSHFSLTQGKLSFHDQFFYKFAIDVDCTFGAFFSIYHNAVSFFGAVLAYEDAVRHSKLGFGNLFQTSAAQGIHRTLVV
ncbi:MAG: hypothetical protein INF93_16710 [Rhodobacter sp.]|nr:hypothetical protein [Rhodobacter sp.]